MWKILTDLFDTAIKIIEEWQILIGLSSIAVNLFFGLLTLRSRDTKEDLTAFLYAFMKSDENPTSDDVTEGYIYYNGLVEQHRKRVKESEKTIKEMKQKIKILKKQQKSIKSKFKR